MVLRAGGRTARFRRRPVDDSRTRCVVDRDLAIGTGALGNDARKPGDLAGAAQRLNGSMNEIQHLAEPGGGICWLSPKRINEGGADAVTLRVPFVFHRNRTSDAVEAGIQRAIAVERADQTTE